MKKLFTVIIAALTVVAACFSFAACGNNQSAGKSKIKAIEVDLSSEQYAFAVKKGDDELKASVNQFFKDKKTEIDEIFDKYTSEGVDLSSFGKSDIKREATGSSDELVIATNLEFPPFEYTNGNKIAGIDMEIAELLAQYLNKSLVVENMDFNAVVTSVATIDKYDLGIAGLTITSARKEEVDFTDSYFGATQWLVVKADDTTFNGLTTVESVEDKLKELSGNAAKCGGQKATTSQFYIQGNKDFGFDGFENLTFNPYQSAALAVTDMLNGNISFVVVDKATANALVSSFVG